MTEFTSSTYLFHKATNWSLFHYGFNIDLIFQKVFYDRHGKRLEPGEKSKIVILFDHKEYEVMLTNLGFDRMRYIGHAPIVQVRYTQNSPIANHLKEVFYKSYQYILTRRNMLEGNRKHIKLPPGEEEYLALYTTLEKGVFVAEAIVYDEHKAISSYLSTVSEVQAEEIISYENWKDPTAEVIIRDAMIRVRRLNRSIGNELKILYDHKCQICGENFAEKYDGKIVEAHHIESFVQSLNNDARNLLIVCPSHHRTIHALKPEFDRKEKLYIYPNHLKERLRLNEHL